LRDRVEEVPQIQSDESQWTRPQVPSAPSSGVIGPPSTSTGSQMVGTQTTGARASRFQPSVVRSMDETEGHEGTAPQKVTSGERKPR
jgi:hypothetical protein